MKHEVVAKPYARALFGVATARMREEQVGQALAEVITTWDNDPEFAQFIRRPEVPSEAKRDAVGRVFPDLDAIVRQLIHIVIDKHREDLLSTIYAEYQRLWDEQRAVVQAQVITASPLTAQQQQDLVDVLSQATKRTVEVTVQRDPSLIAGMVVRMGDRVLDGSLARRLALLGDRLRSGDGGGSVVEH
ncbi:MAG: ATP synthase F1 subunit delta [Sulfobacillus acidophilus]|uniref:ATP synthase subunit delta n=1 Tax=Sulfobacillus acidophilus TaxID=53633 RepID=A0A2T2WF86_9FIRM|nr:MAG: ATP synthase F1 subunit delta [Sulfobacillus acidophilus]